MSDTILADTTGGKIRGEIHRDVAVFRAIPFATARRFGHPEPVEAWEDVRDCLDWGAMCPQSTSLLDDLVGTKHLPMSEDCLTLNVFTPACDDQSRPVLVWIHGGAFTAGTASTPWYSGTSFARNGDVVVVTINYRLNIFGFLHVDGATNLGLRDQVTALEWVRDNVATFGGDPANVTIFGESAGGCSVVALLAVPAARGLFQRAVAQSPSITQLRSTATALSWTEQTLRSAGVTSLPELAKLPTERLVALAQDIASSGADAGFQSFSPAPDGDFLPGPVREAIGQGSSAGVPLVIGTTRDEMRLFTFMDPSLNALDHAGLVERLLERFGDRAQLVADRYRAARPSLTAAQLFAAVASDEVFRRPAVDLATRQSVHAPVYTYLFEWETPAFGGSLGSCHGLEIPFVFDNVHQKGVALFTGDGPDRASLAREMNAAWVRFAHDGDPGWPRFDTAARTTKIFSTPVSRLESDPGGDLLDLWN
jgi:para-nitrobenzyl esterase